jgi:hypothetical protein
MTVVLRKSHGAFSAGTRVTILDRDKRQKYNLVKPHCSDQELHVHDNDLVELRSHELISTRPPRWIRRKEKNAQQAEASS